MTILYEVFTSLESIKIKDEAINKLLGYPKPETKTYQYRKPFSHPTEELFGGIVEDELTKACKDMDDPERCQYYDADNLFTRSYLKDHGWFADQIGD